MEFNKPYAMDTTAVSYDITVTKELNQTGEVRYVLEWRSQGDVPRCIENNFTLIDVACNFQLLGSPLTTDQIDQLSKLPEDECFKTLQEIWKKINQWDYLPKE